MTPTMSFHCRSLIRLPSSYQSNLRRTVSSGLKQGALTFSVIAIGIRRANALRSNGPICQKEDVHLEDGLVVQKLETLQSAVEVRADSISCRLTRESGERRSIRSSTALVDKSTTISIAFVCLGRPQTLLAKEPSDHVLQVQCVKLP